MMEVGAEVTGGCVMTGENGCGVSICCCCLSFDGLQVCESLRWLRCIPLQLELVAVAVEMFVAQMLMLHFSFVKVSVASKKLHSLVSKCLKVFHFKSLHLRGQVVAQGCSCCLLLLS